MFDMCCLAMCHLKHKHYFPTMRKYRVSETFTKLSKLQVLLCRNISLGVQDFHGANFRCPTNTFARSRVMAGFMPVKAIMARSHKAEGRPTKISTGDHDAVGGSHNIWDVGDRVIALHLGHHFNDLGAPGSEVALQVVDHVSSLDK